MKERQPGRLPERRTTIRSELRTVLREGLFSSREISARLGISEKDVAGHLEHLIRSLHHDGDERLEVDHARCLACGFAFKDRARVTRPSRCPRCKAERVAPARYAVVAKGARRAERRPDA